LGEWDAAERPCSGTGLRQDLHPAEGIRRAIPNRISPSLSRRTASRLKKPLIVVHGATVALQRLSQRRCAFARNEGTITAYARAVGVINPNLTHDRTGIGKYGLAVG
jgi:hypothetical protein